MDSLQAFRQELIAEIQLLSGLLVPVIAALGVWIAYRQHKTNQQQADTARQKLRLDLFDRRLVVYEATMKFFASVFTSGYVNGSPLTEYMTAVRGAKWILDDEIHDYLNKTVYHQALAMQVNNEELKAVPVGPDRSAMAHRNSELMTWFTSQPEALVSMFNKYLRLSD